MIELYETLHCSNEGIRRCAQIIMSGGVIVFPTDTVYGIGCDPYNDDAVKRIFGIKGREEKKALPVLVSNIAEAENIISLCPKARALATKFWPGALTIVAPLTDKRISARVTSGMNTLAVRVPANKCVLEVLNICKYLVGTSANLSGSPASTRAEEVLRSLSGFDAILIDKDYVGNTESTVVDVSGTAPKIIREGAINADTIRRVLEDE